MGRFVSLPVACAFALQGGLACDDNDASPAPVMSGQVADGAARGTSKELDAATDGANDAALLTAAGALNDAEMLDVLVVACGGEVLQAMATRAKVENTAVREFAERMAAEYTADKMNVTYVASSMGLEPAENPVTVLLGLAGEVVLRFLKDTPKGAAFDRACMQIQVDDHETLLAVVDKMLEHVDSPVLKTFLTAMRTRVQVHLDDASAVLAELD